MMEKYQTDDKYIMIDRFLMLDRRYKFMKICFMGSMKFAVPILEGLYNNHDVLLVVTQPDKPAGRKKQ